MHGRVQLRLTRLAFRPHLPRRTVRLRLTLLYGGLFLASGAVLLTVTYLLVLHATSGFIFKGPNGSNGAVVTIGSQHLPHGGQSLQARGLGINGLTPQQLQAQARQIETQALQQHASVLNQLLLQSAIALAAMALASIALGWIIAGRVLRPLRTITATARDISATNLHERLALEGPDDELKELGDTFDALLARLEASFQTQRRFIANASHELRTPLARQRTLAQVALADPGATAESLRAAHERVLASGVQQERLLEALLTLARGQAGIQSRAGFDLADVSDQVLLSRRREAEDRGIDVHSALSPAAAAGDPRLIERLIANLIDNALRHNSVHGRVDVATRITPGHAVLSVLNTGPVVPPSAVDQLFQPFKRLGTDRTARGDGIGLGLSIVRAIADAHDARVAVDPQPSGGLRIEVSFPLAARRGQANGLELQHGADGRSRTRPGPALTPDRSPTPL